MADLRQRRLRSLLTASAALLCSLLAMTAASAADTQARPLQCWTDEHGLRACGDTVPPSEARRQRELMNQRGVVKKVIPAEKTPEELAEETRVRNEQAQREAYDRYLLQAYQDVGEIEKVRDERLAALDGRLLLARKALDDTDKILDDLHNREKAAPPEGESLDPSLKRQLREFTTARDGNQAAITRITQERIALTEQFARDMQRYKLLRQSAKTTTPR